MQGLAELSQRTPKNRGFGGKGIVGAWWDGDRMTETPQLVFRPTLRQWNCIAFVWAYLSTPMAALVAVLCLSQLSPGLASVVALSLAALGTSLQSYLELRRMGRCAVDYPHERAKLIRAMQPAGLVWGLMATASWVGLFAQIVG